MNQIIENNYSYSKKGIFFFLVFQIVFILLYILHSYQNNLKEILKYKDIYFSSEEEKNRNLELFNIPYTKEDFIRDYQRKTIFTNLIKKYYEGTWEAIPLNNIKNNNISEKKNNDKNKYNNNFKVGKSNKGKAILKFDRAIDSKAQEEALAIIFKLYEDDYIDNWFIGNNFAKIKNIYFYVTNKTKENDTLVISSEYLSNYEKGKIFTTKESSNINCNTDINISFPSHNIVLFISLNNGSKYISNITSINNKTCELEIKSSCGFNLKFTGKLLENKYHIIKKKINFYSFLLISVNILTMISTTILTQNLSNNHNVLSALNLFSVSQKFIWHSYCCMSNITLAFKHPSFFFKFCIISFSYLINFTVFDSRLLFSYWKIQRSIINNNLFMRLKFMFFFFFYIFFFNSFFFLCSFFYDYFYISLNVFLLWIPQIVHNIIRNNKFSFPLFYLIGNTLDRIIIPFYFRGYDDNFIRVKKNLSFILILLSFIIFCIFILYLQLFLGNRFLFPKKCQIEEYNYYKNKEELLSYKKNIGSEECVICLFPIFEQENNNNNKIINEKTNDVLKGDEIISSLNSDQLNRNLYIKANIDPELNHINLHVKDNKIENNNNNCLSLKEILSIIFCKNFFHFYKLNANIHKKKYMLTPCHHVFHTECLEIWFNNKKECPNCRTPMN